MRCANAEQSAKQELQAIEDCDLRSEFELTAISAANYGRWNRKTVHFEASNQGVILHPRAKDPFHIGTSGNPFWEDKRPRSAANLVSLTPTSRSQIMAFLFVRSTSENQ